MVRRRFLSSSATKFELYHPDFVPVKNYLAGRQGKTPAEVRVKYFFCVKISTRMLIRLWKSRLRAQLTSRPSTLFCSLHHLWAILFFLALLFGEEFRGISKI